MPPNNNPNQPLSHLTTILARTTTEKITSLHLISDSIAQQRQTASRAILLHPLTLTLLSLILVLLSQHFYKTTSDWILLLTTTTGCIATLISFTRYITSGYLDEAERVGTWRWLYSNHHHNSNPPQNQIPNSNDPRTIDMGKDGDLILITKFGYRIIGTLVLRVADTVSELDEHIFVPEERLRIGVLGNGIKIGVIRAWAVQLQYRGVRVGRSLLEAAVEVSRKRGWRGPVFSVGHANSKWFGLGVGSMEMERYEWAWELLEDVRGEFGIVGG
ncbi:hypothetical protein AFGD_003467 [Aspergillus flavus]|nr:hypothetical protein AFGD_003467 [Aspergillus flavus]